MRKQLFLWSAIVIAILVLVLAFENIWLVQQYFILFFTFNSSTTVIVLLSAILGFLVGFFAMLYSFEVQKLKNQAEDEDMEGISPAEAVEKQPAPQDQKKEEAKKHESSDDDFDDDDEVLG